MKHILNKLVVLALIVALLPLGFVRNANALTGGIVQLSDTYTGHISQYMIYFGLGTALQNGDTITLVFPTDTTFTQSGDLKNYVKIDSTLTPTSAVVSGTTLTITVPQDIPIGTHHILILQSAGVKNPVSPGNKQIQISTSRESTAVNSSTYTINTAFYDVGVAISPSPGSAGNPSTFVIYFTSPLQLNAGSYIYIDFPQGTTLPGSSDANARKNYIVVNGTYPLSVSTSQTRLSIQISAQIPANYPSQITISDSFGILQPLTTDYNLYISLSSNVSGLTTAVSTLLNPNPSLRTYAVVGTQIGTISLNIVPNTAYSVARYEISFAVTNAISGTSDWIEITFPNGTTIPTNTSAGYIYVGTAGNIKPASSRTVNGQTLRIYLNAQTTIPANTVCYVYIYEGFGIVNPTVGYYNLSIKTSKDVIPRDSPTYVITGTSISNLDVAIDPPTQNANAQYTITFRTSSTGALSRSSSDKIFVQFPLEFTIPGSISGAYVTVNNTPCTTTITNTNGKLTITTPVDISANSQVTVVISKNANIVNPSNAGTYQIKVSTSKDVVEVGDTVNIVTSIISKPQVQLTSYAVNDPVGVTIIFNTGSGGALTTSDTISIVFPSQFTLPNSISTSYVKVNNYNALQVTKSGYRLDIKPAVNIGANAQVTIIIDKSAGIKNPQQQGDYKISVYTSKETTPVDSDTFKIVMLPVTKATVTPAQPDGENGYYKTKPIVTLTATSPVDTNPQIYYYIDTGTPQLYTAPISIPDGIHTLYFYAKDKYGNTENPQSIQFKVDTVKPAITIISPQDNAVLNSKDITIKGSLSEQGSVTINGVPVTVKPDLTFEYSTTIAGKTTFTIVAKDIAGNTSQTTLTVSLDTTPPKLTVTKPRAFETVNVPYVDVEGVTDADAVKVTVNGQSVQIGSDFKFTYRVTLTTEGLNSIDVIAEDLAGNKARQVIPINYVAKTKLILQVDNKNAVLNDKAIQLDAPPKIVNGRTLVPIRTITTAFNVEITWEPVFKLVIIKLGDTVIYLQIGTKYASVNGKKVDLDVAPQIISNYTYVPLRFISESLNASVEWDGTTKTIIIIYPK
jgi:hypothetical protein